MSAAKHTPGPWWVTDQGVRDSGGYICHTIPPTRYEGQDERYEREIAERAANKTMIAAAPSMYDYIISSASNGCAEARRLLGVIHGNA